MSRRTVSRVPRCLSCGCTEFSACMVVAGGQVQGCAWVLVDNKRLVGLCSACATTQQLVWAVLEANPVRLPVSDIAFLSGRHPTSVGHALRKLEQLKLATRTRGKLGVDQWSEA